MVRHLLIAASALMMLAGEFFHATPLRAAGQPAIGKLDSAKLIAETERLLPAVARTSERIRFECAIAYLTLRGRPIDARRRFDEILAAIDAADEEFGNATESYDDNLNKLEARLKVAEWMGRTGLREEARKLLLHVEREKVAAFKGMVWGSEFGEDIVRFAAIGFDDDARRLLSHISEETDLDSRVRATTGAALELRRSGHLAQAEFWKRAALDEAARMKKFHYSSLYPLVEMLATFRDERELLAQFAKAERAGMKPDEQLALHVRYLRTLMTTGREAEARAIVERFEKLPRNGNTAGFHCPLLVAIGECDRAAAVNRAQPMSKSFPNDEKYRRHSVARIFRNLAMQSRSGGDLATARRFYREHVEIRAEDPLRGFSGSREDEPEFLRDLRFGDAVFALECGEIGALLKLAKEEPMTDRHHAEFRCRCNLATALELEPPHQLAPPNPFLGKYWHRGFRVRL
jgi:hypothetical protein